MSARYVTIHRSYDPLQTAFLGDLLRDNGVAARVLGTRNAAMVGVGQNIMQSHIEVPQDQAGVATDFLEAFFSEDAERDELAWVTPNQELEVGEIAGDSGEDEEEDCEGSGDQRPVLRATFAAGSVMLLFGGAHLYARQTATAGILALGQVLALSQIGAHAWSTAAMGMATFAMILVVDLIGGQQAVRQHNRGVTPGTVRQILRGTLLLAVAGGIGALVGLNLPEPEPKRVEIPGPNLVVPR